MLLSQPWLGVAVLLCPTFALGDHVGIRFTTTPAAELRPRQTEASIDPASLAQVLLTAVPASLRQLAATNIPAVSKILWSEFLDGHTPSWFGALPTDIQSYLSKEFGPSTTHSGTAESTTTQSSSLTSSLSSSPTSSAPSKSTDPATVFATSMVTITVQSSQTLAQLSPTQDPQPHSGLSTGSKIGIGVGVPLAVLALAALILVACLLCRRRRQRRRSRVDSRPPTPAFLSNSYRETSGLRGGAAPGASDSEGWDSNLAGRSYTDIPAVAPRQNRGSQQSFGSLHSVPEEHPETNQIGVLPVPSRSPRRSRVGSSELRGAAYTAPPGMKSNVGGLNYAPMSPQKSGYDVDVLESQHPAYRNRGSFSTPNAPYIGNSTSVSGPETSETLIRPGSATITQPPAATSNWPFSRNYWKVERPGYDKMYEGT